MQRRKSDIHVLSGKEGPMTWHLRFKYCKSDLWGSWKYFFFTSDSYWTFIWWVTVTSVLSLAVNMWPIQTRISLWFLLCDVKMVNYVGIMSKASIWQGPAVGSWGFFCTRLFLQNAYVRKTCTLSNRRGRRAFLALEITLIGAVW